MRNKRLPIALMLGFVCMACAACDGQDSDYIPYMLKGMNVYVYDEDDREFFAGRVDGNYLDRDDLLSSCGAMAAAEAERRHLGQRWGYVCCTVTSESSCVTKVR